MKNRRETMLKWTSVLAFVVACCVEVTALCADASPKKAVCISDLTERPTRRMVSGPVEVPAYGIVTLRAE